ncbi:hypothetical protein EXIGLDRAFT_676374 [Exidia glandulosa HHB12029]|uniref:Vacuolar protein sorting-associated protein 13 second N-terminal domain-containing protein n=1 Tax=Exidia glandulosa HHB12029 TaxID=1314781 RepID=A0A165GX46_EXIGL|nr:hypothetical protein EXIGLDRAFT_676374 [Exidia glandulosa HHB12029]
MDNLGKIGAADVGAKVKAIEQQLSKFAEASQVVMKGLDAIQQVHPFIGIAVMALKAAVQLELTRRQNDKKVLLLKTQMVDMMDVLRNLKDVKDPSRVDEDGTSLQGRMQRVLEQAASDIRDCSAMCEKYLHKKFIVKLFDGARWEGRLAGFGETFGQRKDDFTFALSIHTARGVDKLQQSMVTSQDQLSMLLLFVQLESPEEREMINLINEKGGPEACLKDEHAFAELQAKMKAAKGSRESGDVQIVIGEIREDMKEDIDAALAKERRAFDRKFDAIQETLDEMKSVVTRSSDRILSAINSGPHDRILDKDLHHVWKDMAWRGSVKARHFIVAVQDYFLQKYGGEGDEIPVVDGAAPDPSNGQDAAQDKWAIKYITLTRVRPILEAFDDDASGWISIKEANTFTSTRPLDYSVLKWLAFWAAGFRVVCTDYARKIDGLRVQMIRSATDVLPCNRLLVDKYLRSWNLDKIDYITRGVLTKDAYDRNDDDDDVLEHFQDFVQSEEARLQKSLDRFGVIDDSSTLSLILGPGRLERSVFPLVYLVLKRHYDILRLAAQVRIDDQELDDADESLANIVDALFDRLHALIYNFRNQNLDPKQQVGHAYNRMYSVYYDSTTDANVSAYEYKNVLPASDADSSEPKLDLLRYDHGPPSVPHYFYDSFIAEEADLSDHSTLEGLWIGRHYYGDLDDDYHDGMLVVRIVLVDGKITGEGKDALGKFTIEGKATSVDDAAKPNVRMHIEFDTTSLYLSEFYLKKPVRRYIGDVEFKDGAFIKISGKWSTKEDDSDESDENGDFVLERSLAIVARHRPAVLDTAQARWNFLATVVLEQVRRRRWSWTYFRTRREDRIRVIEASQRFYVLQEPHWYLRKYPPGDETDWEAVRQEVECRLVVEDIAFYRWVAQQRLRSETVHLGVNCDGCKGSPIGARFICLDCRPANPDQRIDLCSNCTEKAVSAPAPRNLEHVASHDMVKTLRVLSRRELVQVLNAGRSRLATARTRLGKVKDSKTDETIVAETCRMCSKEVTQPCWYCIECTGGAFLCDTCEHKQLAMMIENPKRDANETVGADAATAEQTSSSKEKDNDGESDNDGDSASESENDAESGSDSDSESGSEANESNGTPSSHFWWHILVRVRPTPAASAPTKLELDARLSLLEQKFGTAQSKLENIESIVVALDDKLDTGLEGRMEKLENAVRVQQGLFDAQVAGLETLLRQVLSKLG